jgi:hypothetical protein
MTQQLKNDIKTIIEVLIFIILLIAISTSRDEWISNIIIVLVISLIIYNGYYKRTNKNLMVFPTQNDNSVKMAPISFGIVICIFSVVGYFAFSLTIYKVLALFVIGIAVCLFGFFELPQGWVSIENNVLKLYGIGESIDTRQLKEIVLKNDKIILTDVYGENQNSYNLNLNPLIANKIKKFLEERLCNKEVSIIDNVTAPV